MIREGAGSFAERLEQVLKAVHLDFIYRLQHFAKLARRESLLGKPDYVGLGEIDELSAGVFSERHTHFGQFK
jgi:hypothetical protein